MGKKSKTKTGKAKDKYKTLEQRQAQIDFINSKLQEIQLDDRIPEIEKLHKIMNEYIKTGVSISGKMPLPNSNKNIVYILSNRANTDCKVNLITF